jgi:drug/metabolite transporter (DMT)-like permease
VGPSGWALVSAFLGGLGVVLQQKGAMAAPPARSARFVGAILRTPVWLAGAGCQFGCWAAQGIALSKGPLSLVQPIVALQIVIALPLGVAFTRQRVGRREWLGAGLVVVGVAVFVAATNPHAGRSDVPAGVWLAASVVVIALTVVAAVLGVRRPPAERAALLAAGAGILFGYQAAVMKAFVAVVPHGLDAILSSWTTYGLIASAVGGFYLLQSALQVGVLAPAIATSNATSPVTSVVLGRIVFLETPQRTRGGAIVSACSAALLLVGIVLLARREPS